MMITHRYLGTLNTAEKLEKVGNAVTSISSAVEKFESDKAKDVISGVLDVGVAISEFLPPPHNAVMAPVSAIFNGIFGIGGGPSTEETIAKEMLEMKKYIAGEFTRLSGKIDIKFKKLNNKLDEMANLNEVN